MAEELARAIRKPIRFTKRPNPVAPDFRPDWKVSLLLLILHVSSRGGKSSLTRLHTLNWAVRTKKHQNEFFMTRTTDAPLFAFKVRFEPAFSRAIDLAAAAKLVNWVGGDRIELTPLGTAIAKSLLQQNEAFAPEVEFLERIGKRVTEDDALKLVRGPDIA